MVARYKYFITFSHVQSDEARKVLMTMISTLNYAITKIACKPGWVFTNR